MGTKLKRRKHVQIYKTKHKFEKTGSCWIKTFNEIKYREKKSQQIEMSSEKVIKNSTIYNRENANENLDTDDEDTDDEESLLVELSRIIKEKREKTTPEILSNIHKEAASRFDERNFFLEKRWDDDVAFKGQAKCEPCKPRRFINDTVRSDFHKKFMHRYIK